MNLCNKNHPVYEPEKWNKDVNIKTTHNCYSYALNLINPKMAEICKEYKKINKKQITWIILNLNQDGILDI